MEDNDVVVSQEDAQYIIERQRREIQSLQSSLQSLADLIGNQHSRLVKELKGEYEWLDFERFLV